MKKKGLYLLLMLGVMCLLTGCWDNAEINDKNIVLELAIDKAENVENKIGQEDYYEVTYTIPDIKKLSGKDSLSDDVKTSMVTISPTMVKSIDEMEARMQNTLTFSHVKAVLLGEELLKDQQLLENIINSLSRNIEFSRGVNILAVQGKAGDITKAENPQNPIVGMYVMKYFGNTAKGIGNAKQQSMGNILKEIQNTGVTTIPIISSDKDNTLKIGGAAVIKDYQLAGWLSEQEVKGMTLVQGKIEEMPIVIEYKGDYLTYNIKEKKSKISFKENEGLEATIKVEVKGNVTEGLSAMNDKIFAREDIKEIEQQLTKKINEEIKQTIQKEKELGVDFLNIELELYRKHPKLWTQYKNAKQNLNDITILLDTQVTIENTGIIE